jgi:tRNA(Leu) C34 or U34 (ribose-2'-O)-methylase TrmL
MNAVALSEKYEGVVDRRGFAAIGLYQPKTPENFGGVMRAAMVFGAKLVAVQSSRLKDHGTNTTKSQRHIPTIMTDDLLLTRPWHSQLVVVEVANDSVRLDEFTHPQSAFYVFGPEDGSVPKHITERAQHVVTIRGWHCVNLAVAVNLVLHDRICKRGLGT